ncbi:HtaA domain-containing protein [Williamsia muralis]|uniref:Htaa domain-containing protein n=1 Tax=Williamsia marianensis TaxID=85044 RepID=A0A2G3PM23_WILMA|nr:HtaA domain-containing protein [Williamsia marianensis]PHV66152.1 hypothetical protein CSW57_21275 [Williamsia marianensis]
MPDSTGADVNVMNEDAGPTLGLRWPIKRTFVNYVRGMTDGKGSATHGASVTGSMEFLYENDPGFSSTDEWRFRGDVRFAGHSGLLFVKIADPRITVVGADGVAELTVVDPYGSDTRLKLATLRVSPQHRPDGIQMWTGTDVRLSAEGVGLFNDVYQPGEEFDSLEILQRLPRQK